MINENVSIGWNTLYRHKWANEEGYTTTMTAIISEKVAGTQTSEKDHSSE
jgi:hypothetical protein